MKSLVDNMNIMSDEVSAVLSANQTIVDGIHTLSGISQEISASSTASKEDMDDLTRSVTSFAGAVDDTFAALERLKATATVEEEVEE